MIISLNWIKKFIETDLDNQELIDLISSRLVEVEEVVDLNKKYESAVLVRVMSAEKIAGSDHLSLVKIDDNQVVKNVERDEQGYVQVVCGATNVYKDMITVWLPPKAIVPVTYFSAEPFMLESRVLKGVVSHGMLASPRELDISDEHQGIIDIQDEVDPGTPFAKAYELDDILLTVDNKALTRRSDCFGILGFAREVSVLLGQRFIEPKWFLNPKQSPVVSVESKKLQVKIIDETITSRYQAVVLENLDGKQVSPLSLQTYLSRLGVRPINLIVDTTNYLMLLTGQPLHAFDYDKLIKLSGQSEVEIVVRLARDGERLELLDGREIILSDQDIIITSHDQPIALAGAMGGSSTAIDATTTRIVLESASFNLHKLRLTQMRHGVFSEAVTRFIKGLPAEVTEPTIRRAMRMLEKLGGAQVLQDVVEDFPAPSENSQIVCQMEAINQILGKKYQAQEIQAILTNAGFNCQVQDAQLLINPPFWRPDIRLVEDVAEEVGRISGFDNIPITLPQREFKAVSSPDLALFKKELRANLVRLGANEVLSYSFVHGDLIKKAKQPIKEAYRLVNSISPALQYYRLSLSPSLLNLVFTNVKAGFNKFALFEINKTHCRSSGVDGDGVPLETEALAVVVATQNKISGAPYYLAKNLLDKLAKISHLAIGFRALTEEEQIKNVTFQPFSLDRSALIYVASTGKVVGVVGEYQVDTVQSLKLPTNTAGFEIDIVALFEAKEATEKKYSSISRFPATERDVCLRLNQDISYQTIYQEIQLACDTIIDYRVDFRLLDSYKPEQADFKNLTFRFQLVSFEKTITRDEANTIMEQIIKKLKTQVNLEVI